MRNETMTIAAKILNKFDEHTQELIGGAYVAFVLKIVAAGMAFLLNIVLARLLGAEGAGIFFLAFTIVVIMAGIGTIGMENTLVRFIAANVSVNKLGKVLGVYKKAILYSFMTAGSFSFIFYFISPWISQNLFNKTELGEPLSFMSLAILPLALLNLHAFALQGLKKIAASISILSIFVPLLTGLATLFLVPIFGINAAISAYLLATVVTLVIGFFFWRKVIAPYKNNTAEFDTKKLLYTSMPLLGVNIMNLIILWSPIIFLGIWANSEDVGIYNAASRTAMLTSFVLIAVNSIAAPKFAELYKQGDTISLELLASNSTKLMVLASTPILLIFVFFPELVLSIFGNEFIQGAEILTILAAGQFVNVATGSVGYLLIMSGNEKVLHFNLLFCALLCILLNIFLVKGYGLFGAAIAASITLSLQNIISFYLVKRKLGLFKLASFIK